MNQPCRSVSFPKFLTISLGVLLLLPALAGAADSTQALQGTWSGTRFSSGTGDDPSKGVRLELTFTGNHVNARRLPEGEIGEGDITLAEGGKIDALGTSAKYKGKSYQGIIKIDGDTLIWCTATGDNQVRPTEFAADPAKRSFLIVVKRQKS